MDAKKLVVVCDIGAWVLGAVLELYFLSHGQLALET
jgi:hypothetical protein